MKKAAESSPEDLNVKFNYGLALFLDGSFPESAIQLRSIIASRPSDGETYYLLSKALVQQNDTANAATIDNQARTFLTGGNRYAGSYFTAYSNERFFDTNDGTHPSTFSNRLIREYLATQRKTKFIDVFSLMLDAEGKPRKELFGPDMLHMNATGYAIWQKEIEPVLKD